MSRFNLPKLISALKENYVFIIILSFGIFLRLILLANHPSGFHNDEVSFYINARSLMETGMDEDGNRFPLYLASFIDTKPALYSYLQIPFILFMNDEILASRSPAFVFGILSLIIFYLLVKEMKNQRIALISLLFLAISPWHIIVVRGTQEVIMSFAFQLFAIYSLFKIINSNRLNGFYIVTFSISTLLAMYSYHAAKVFLPLYLTSVLLISLKPEKANLKKFLSVVVVVVISLAVTISLGGMERAKAVSIFSDPGTKLILHEQIGTATNSTHPILIRLFHNKVLNHSLLFARQYMEYFNADFLFFVGGEPKRYSVPFHGLFYLIQLPLMVLGIIKFVFHERNRKLFTTLMLWILIAPLAGAVTIYETPSLIRTFSLVVPLTVLLAYGVLFIFDIRNKVLKLSVLSIFVIGFILNFMYFMHEYFVQQPNYHPWYRNYADQQLATTVQRVGDRYDRVVISGGGDMYVYFVLDNLISIEQIQKIEEKKRSENFTIGKYTFIRNSCVVAKEENTLYIVQVTCEDTINDPRYISVGKVEYKDKAKAYELLQFNKNYKHKKIISDVD